jgi:hypothetical protein
MKKIDRIVKDMIEHANNAGTVVEEFNYGPEHGAVEDEYGDDAAMDDDHELAYNN